MRKILLFAFLALFAVPVFGQGYEHTPIAGRIIGEAPGSIWSEVGLISPIESSNVIGETGATQSFIVKDWRGVSLAPFVAGGFTLDTAGHPWNNQIMASIGGKANIAVPHGVISFNLGYGYQNRFKEHSVTTAPEYFISDWFGWHLPAIQQRYPGHTWMTYGAIAPIEGNNKILYGYVQQGVSLEPFLKKRFPNSGEKFKQALHKMVLFGEVTAARDSKHFDWDNFVRPGMGAKVVLSENLEIGASYVYEFRSQTNLRAGGASIFLKYDSTWSLLGRR